MDIQSISGVQQTMNTVRTNFQNFSTAAGNLQSALNSGNQDQVTLSESALSQALNQVLSVAPDAQGQSSAGSGNPDPMQTFQSDLQTLQGALTTANGNQGAASSNSTLAASLSNVLSDLSSMKSHGHHHHHHSGGAGSGGAQGQDPMQAFQSDLLALQSALTSANGSQGAASSNSAMQTALGNILNGLSYFTQVQPSGAGNNAVNISA